MRHLFLLLIFSLIFVQIFCVVHKQFKTCLESGFCNRNRIFAEHILNEGLQRPWTVQEIKAVGPRLNFKIVRLNQFLGVSLVILKNGALKLTIDPVPFSNRYKIPLGDVTIDEAASIIHHFKENGDSFKIIGTGLSVKLSSVPFSITIISTTDGEIIKLNDQNLFNFEDGFNVAFPDIAKSITKDLNTDLWNEPNFSDKKTQDPRKKGPTSFGMDISFTQSKAIYGIPEHSTSLALKSTRGINENDNKVYTRSDPYRLFNLDVFEYELDSTMALYGAIPIMLGHNPQGSDHRSVGIFWNNPSETWIDVFDDSAKNGKLTHWMSESGSFSVYIMTGKDLKALQGTILALTGSPQLPPTFALGYHQCRWNYKTVDDVLQVNQNFDEHSLPMDVIWLDIEHTDDKKYMTWHPKDFKDSDQMILEVSRTGRKMVTIVDPHLKKDQEWEIYRELVSKNLAVKSKGGKSDFEGNCWPGQSVWTDYTNPEARKWWAGLFSFDKYNSSTEDLYIWNDMNEPTVFNSPEMTMPRDNIHHGGIEHRDIHNLYGKYQQMSTFQGLKNRSEGKKRPFLLSRSFYAGSQQFGAIWTGDNTAEWTHLAASGPMLMSLGVVGYHFAGADVGGFFGNPNSELLVRWYQAGSMQPFFRAHAHIETRRREPWLFGEVVTNQIREALKLRYSLLPLWYTAFEESSRTGVPPMRPMFLEYPDDETLLKVEDQWMISSSLLFKLISTADQKSAQVILPRSAIWYNYFTMLLVENPTGIITETDLTLDRMLLYIRGGSIIARKDIVRRSSHSMKFDPYTIVVALDEKGEANGYLYVDDGESYEYKENSAFAKITFNAALEEISKTLKFEVKVIGETALLPANMLNVNRLILIHPQNGPRELSIDLCLTESSKREISINY